MAMKKARWERLCDAVEREAEEIDESEMTSAETAMELLRLERRLRGIIANLRVDRLDNRACATEAEWKAVLKPQTETRSRRKDLNTKENKANVVTDG